MARFSNACLNFVGLITIAAFATPSTYASDDLVASKSLTIQATGPRQGAAGGNYFNVQGKNKERYAGFGVLVFPLTKGEAKTETKSLTVTLVQSIPAFAADGKITFYIAHPRDPDPSSLEKLKYDPAAPAGLPKDAFKSLLLLGTGEFKKVATGQSDTFVLKLDEMARNELRSSIKGGDPLHIVVAPGDDDVAATYFGAGNETESNRPRVKLDGEATK
jgi:hypothetical protein